MVSCEIPMPNAILVDACASRWDYANSTMNRIKEIREAAGLTQEGLAELVGTTGNHIWRLESGNTQLTQQWMTLLAEALHCHPADLMKNVVAAETALEIEPAAGNPVVASIAVKGLKVYRVIERSVINLGIAPGDTITVDESEPVEPRALDVVVVEVGEKRNRVLRQFVPPSMLVTNRGGANLAIDLKDPTVTPKIVGIVLRPGGSP
jgi:transcriptional regulator with XRE-family HTH domain